MDIFERKFLLLSMSLFYSISYGLMVTECISEMEYVFFFGFFIFIYWVFFRCAFKEFQNLYLSKSRNHLASDINPISSENKNSFRRKVRFSPYIEIIDEDNSIKDISVNSVEESDRISQEYQPRYNDIAVSYVNRENLQQDTFNGMFMLEYEYITEMSEEIIESNQDSFLSNNSQMRFDGKVFLTVLNKLCCSIKNCHKSHNKGKKFTVKARRESASSFHEIYYQETML